MRPARTLSFWKRRRIPELLDLSAETRLEVYTEWTDDVPEPQRTATPIRIEGDPAVRAAKVEPDFPDGQTLRQPC